MKKIFSYIRLAEWYDSKVPFMLSAFMYFYYLDMRQYSGETFLIKFIAYMLYISMFLAFSYVINDFSDIEVDRKAGKYKIISKLSKSTVILSMVIMSGIGIIPLLFVINNKVGYLLLTAFIYLAGAAYSIPLFRFKEKGVVGLLECSIAQRCFPLLPLFFIVKVSMLFFMIFQIISFVNGIRYLLIHQNIDYENDLKSGVVTLATTGKINYKRLIKLSMFIETTLVWGLFVELSQTSKFGIIMGLLYLIFECIIGMVVVKYIKEDWLGSFICVPYEDLYNIFIPVFLAILLTMKMPILVFVGIILLLIVEKSFKVKWSFINIFIQIKLKRK